MWLFKFYFIFFLSFSQSANDYVLHRYNKIECTVVDPHKIFKSLFCFVKNYNRTLSTVSLGFTTRIPFDNVMMEHQVFYKYMTNYRSIVNLQKVDICDFMKNVNGNLFLSKPLIALKAAFPNAVFKCPFKELILNNITSETTATIQLFPAGQYKNLYIFTNNEGTVLKVTTFIMNFSKDKAEF